MNRIIGAITVAVCVGALPARLDAQAVQAGPVTVTPTGRVQVQFSTTSIGEEDLPVDADAVDPSAFEARRVWLGARLEVDEWITGRLEVDFASGAELRDAWMNLGFHPAFQLRIGQFKKAFSRIELISSSESAPIERGVRIRGLTDALQTFPGNALLPGDQYGILEGLGYVGRDVGISAHGRLGRISYRVGVFDGNGPGRAAATGAMAAAARLAYRPFAGAPLSMAAALSYRQLDLAAGPPDNDVDGTAFEVDVEWGDFGRPGVHLVAEADMGDNLSTDGTFLGGQGVLAYFLPTGTAAREPVFAFLRSLGNDRIQGVEPSFRVGYGDPDTDRDDDHGWLLTPGINLYFSGRNRLMFGWDAFLTGEDTLGAEHAFRAQAQLYF
ncbi:MAG TPA: porin [Longimicrobiales bacterium]